MILGVVLFHSFLSPSFVVGVIRRYFVSTNRTSTLSTQPIRHTGRVIQVTTWERYDHATNLVGFGTNQAFLIIFVNPSEPQLNEFVHGVQGGGRHTIFLVCAWLSWLWILWIGGVVAVIVVTTAVPISLVSSSRSSTIPVGSGTAGSRVRSVLSKKRE
jgi:hypothetical protein